MRNQAPSRVGLDELADNLPLLEGVHRHDADWAIERLHEAGQLVGSAQYQQWADEANRHPPELLSHDRYGHRIDEVRYHPSYHELTRRSVELGAFGALAWREPRPGSHVARAAVQFLAGQVEAGHCCPMAMTYAAIPALRMQPEIAAEWEPLLTSTDYDPRLVPAVEKGCAISGMAMTEKQGGSDVRSNTTRATPLNGGGPGGEHLITGHKWFCSAPMSDMFLVLAQTDEGLSCFHVPRVLPDGQRNPFRIQRLKDKLGDRSNASSEVEFTDTWGRMVGEPGCGVPTIIEMVNLTRLDCVTMTSAGMRQSVTEAIWHASHRAAFGRRLAEQPLMANVLADLALESEAATLACMRLARAFDEDADASEVLFKRVATAVMKYWICKRGPNHAFEALECLGGNGYTEGFPLARRYRQQPLLSIWEGSGNVMALDVFRALRTPAVRDAFLAEIDLAAGANRHLDAGIDSLRRELDVPEDLERRARRVVELMALVLLGSLLVRWSPAAVSDAYCAERLGRRGGYEYGTLSPSAELETIVRRHAPCVADAI